MAKLEHYTTRFTPEQFYHIYNRSINKEQLFRSSENYRYFLKRYKHYISETLETYAYCLLPDHFHFLVRVRCMESIRRSVEESSRNIDVHGIVAHQLRKLFQSYALAFNKKYQRRGTLFQKPFKRAAVKEESYITNLISYIHLNPQKHRLVKDFRSWTWNSYHSLISERKTSFGKRKSTGLVWWPGRICIVSQYKSGAFG